MTSFVVIGNPENRRLALFQAALARLGAAPGKTLAYADLLKQRVSLRDSLASGATLRLDSPGENVLVEKALLARGAALAEAEGSPFLSLDRLANLRYDHGRILHPRQWFLGFQSALDQWQREVAESSCDVRWMSRPQEIAVLFDKVRCHALCQQAGVPTPDSLPSATSFDHLTTLMTDARWRRAFVKLAHGSSASGVVALQRTRQGFEAITSVEAVRSRGELRLYNSLRVRRYMELDEIRAVVDLLLQEGAQVERWLPTVSLGQRRLFGVCVVTIAGRPRHWVAREGVGPMTNLHLGNRRGDVALARRRLGSEGVACVEDTCRRVASIFPGAMHLGIDILVLPGFRRHAVLEVNAFGDLLPGVLSEGQDTYTAEVAETLASRTLF